MNAETVAGNLKWVKCNKHPEVRPADKPICAGGGAAGQKGRVAPDCAIVNVAGMADLQFSSRARCFDGEEACFEAVTEKYNEGDVLVVRDEGRRDRPEKRHAGAAAKRRVMRTSNVVLGIGLLGFALGFSPAVSFDGTPSEDLAKASPQQSPPVGPPLGTRAPMRSGANSAVPRPPASI